MRHTKSITFEGIKLLPVLILIVLVLTLSACSQESSQNEVSVSGDTLSAPLPSALLAVNKDTLLVGVKVDGGSPKTCTNLSVDQGNGTYSCNITLSGGQHTLSLVFSIIDARHGTIPVATASGIIVNIVPGQTATADFSAVSLNYDDHNNDNDGINNFDELDEGSNPNAASYYIGGEVSGLSGGDVVIQLNGDTRLRLSNNGDFKFIPAIADQSDYTVTVLSEPNDQTCKVSNGSSTVRGANVTNIIVDCFAVIKFTVGGTISGLAGTVTLVNNNVDFQAISTNGDFIFGTKLTNDSPYAVDVDTNPSGQTCKVTNGSGIVSGDVSVSVECSNDGIVLPDCVIGESTIGECKLQ